MSLRERDAQLPRMAGVAWPEAPLLDRLALSPTADVLDVGAGDGRLLAAPRARGHRGRRVGLDPRPGPGVLRGTAGALPFAEAGFDAVLLVRVLAHLPDPRTARPHSPAGSDLLLPVTVGPDDTRAIAASYGLEDTAWVAALPLRNRLHLRIERDRGSPAPARYLSKRS